MAKKPQTLKSKNFESGKRRTDPIRRNSQVAFQELSTGDRLGEVLDIYDRVGHYLEDTYGQFEYMYFTPDTDPEDVDADDLNDVLEDEFEEKLEAWSRVATAYEIYSQRVPKATAKDAKLAVYALYSLSYWGNIRPCEIPQALWKSLVAIYRDAVE